MGNNLGGMNNFNNNLNNIGNINNFMGLGVIYG